MNALPIHPRTGLRAIYVSPRTGRAFWPIAGASDDPPEGDPKPDPKPAEPSEWEKTFEGKTPAEIAKAVEESRKWESRSKENFEKAQKYDAMVAGQGTGPKPAAPTPEAPKEPEPTKPTAPDTTPVVVENAVLKSAIKQNANAARLTDSKSFMAQFDGADPTAPDFSDKVADAIKKAIEADPTLATSKGERRPLLTRGRESEGSTSSLSAGAARYAERHNKTH